jgi:hypothetical protein
MLDMNWASRAAHSASLRLHDAGIAAAPLEEAAAEAAEAELVARVMAEREEGTAFGC